MGEHELHSALRRAADARIRALWVEAETEVAARRVTLVKELEDFAETSAQSARHEATAERHAVAAATARESRRCRLLAQVALAGRLRTLATQLLTELGEAAREKLWQGAVAALPRAEWQALTVHPADESRARRDFAEATVQVDPRLLGGVVAATADGRIVIDNSLAGRLDRGWPELLAELHDVLEGERDHHGTAGARATG
jgi:vacuolar-type H+-ATPase subunit E/Vma4